MINKIKYFDRKIIFSLLIIIISSIPIKLYFFPYGIPVTEDSLVYFRYAIDTSILGHLPNTSLTNNGWPIFLSVFYSSFNSDNFLEYMTLQRIISISISTLTIIPVYLLLRRFFDYKYALLGSILFIFEPRMIQNSFLGITDSLFILFTTSTLFFFLSSRIKIIYIAFSFAALATIVRYEGVILLLLISILYFIKYRKSRKNLLKYCIAISIFILIMLPMSYAKISATGNEGIRDSVLNGAKIYGQEASSNQENILAGIFSYITSGLEAFIKYFGWIMIPYFILFVPLGIILMLKQKNENRLFIIFSIIILSIPALYAYSRGIQETRYLYLLYPIFCIISIFAIKFLQERIKKIIIVIIIVIIISSTMFLIIKNTDYEHEREAFEIAKHVSKYANGINTYPPESKYVRVTGMINEFPILSNSVSFGPKIINPNYESLIEFIQKNEKNGLDHLVLDGKSNRAIFLNDVFINEKKYPYLTNIFDSSDFGYKYHVKIYKINYDKFDEYN
tara:strand:+ start:493 stop:2010 length:1518 start_codon:yes stop_codon:yes gene_type:complete